MPLSAATGLAAYGISAAVKKLDLSEELAEIIRTDNTAFLSRVGASGLVATQLKHSWVEDRLNPNTATEAGAGISTDTTTVAVVAGQGVRFRVGTLFKDNTAGKSEVMRVTGISTDTLTIERGVGSTNAEVHAASFPIMIIAHTKQEDWKPQQEDWSQERTGVYNYLKNSLRRIAETLSGKFSKLQGTLISLRQSAAKLEREGSETIMGISFWVKG